MPAVCASIEVGLRLRASKVNDWQHLKDSSPGAKVGSPYGQEVH